VDEWSGDGDAIGADLREVLHAAAAVAVGAGMEFPPGLGLPERLVVLQEKMKAGDPLARKVYETIGAYVGYGVAHYADFYELKHILVLGRVTTGEGGEILVDVARKVLAAEFPDLAERVNLALPDEKSRRVGQSIAAASLPQIVKEKA
jgi:predicted NBD/HSP70 family sugar kinase